MATELSKKEKNKLQKKEAKLVNKIKETSILEDEDYACKLYGTRELNVSKTFEELKSNYFEISQIGTNMINNRIVVQAYLQQVRKTGKQAFLVLRQKIGTMQCIAYKDNIISSQMIKFISNIPKESFVEVTGVVTSVEKPIESCSQSLLELKIEEIFVISKSKARLNLQIEDLTRSNDTDLAKVNLDTRLDNRVLDLRTTTNYAIFKIKSYVGDFFAEYLKKLDFIRIETPSIIPAASEGGANVFVLPYFGTKAYLAQSPQLYKQMAINAGYEKVYILGPVFRAENSNTHRHLTEFNGLDLEMKFRNNYHEVIDVITGTLIHIFRSIEEQLANEVAIVAKQYPIEPFEFVSPALILPFSEGVRMLRNAGVEMGDYDDLTTTNEKILGRLVKEKYSTDFYVLDKFPLAVRPFYTMPAPEDSNYSNSYDMFMRGEEILSGAQRIHDAAMLRDSAVKHGIQLETIKDYLESFELGSPPHAGGGIGLERVVMLYLGLGNIRNASMFPRDPKRISP